MLKCAASPSYSHTDRRRNIMSTMSGVVLPGDSTVKHVEVDVPEPGHGQVVAVGPGCRRLSVGDLVLVHHIAGCGVCEECRRGYMIGCTSPLRAAHGWQRDGGHAEFLLAEKTTCILLPDELSYAGGALTPHLHPLAHGATAVTRSLTRRPARAV
jgi:threonine dehydrogenase-like Zn-dependent dehydrogenase